MTIPDDIVEEATKSILAVWPEAHVELSMSGHLWLALDELDYAMELVWMPIEGKKSGLCWSHTLGGPVTSAVTAMRRSIRLLARQLRDTARDLQKLSDRQPAGTPEAA